MALLEFVNYPSTDTPINATNLNNNFNYLEDIIKNIYSDIFPIGRGFIDFTDTDYSNWLGFSWERELIGVSPVGYNSADEDFDTIGKTGGSKTHRHTLPIGSVSNSDNVAVTNAYGIIDTTVEAYARYSSASYSSNVGSIRLHYSSYDSNMPPYQVVAYWKRIA